MTFAAIILGGTGQVGAAAVNELLALPQCREVFMVTRKPIASRPRVRNVVFDMLFAAFRQVVLQHHQSPPPFQAGPRLI